MDVEIGAVEMMGMVRTGNHFHSYLNPERDMPREYLYLCDELFMCGTAAEITPIRSVDGKPVGAGKPGPVTHRMQELFFGLFSGKTKDQWGWLEPV